LKNNAHFTPAAVHRLLVATDVMSKGLAPFYRPAIRAVQTAQELQIVPGAVLGLPLDFTEQLRPQGQRIAL
jgi:hypothetical protein